MSKYQAVADSFRALVGTGAADIQNAYGMQGDWCAMTVFTGFRNAGALDNLADGMKTAWVPSLWDWYEARGMTGDNPQAGAYLNTSNVVVRLRTNRAFCILQSHLNTSNVVVRRDGTHRILLRTVI